MKMFLGNYLSDIYTTLVFSNYKLSYLETLDEDNFKKIYNLFYQKGFYYLEDIILNYLEIFELEEESVSKAFEEIENELGANYVKIIGQDLTILNKVIELASLFI